MRLFIGFPLSSTAREDTAALAALAGQVFPGRYAPADNYHMTLAFLGEVSSEQLPDVRQALNAFAARFGAPQLTLCGLSFFARPANAILVRTIKSEEDLSAMRTALLDELTLRGLPFTDGPFSPHVTLARHADVSRTPPDSLPAQPVSFTAPQTVLFLSARDEHDILRYTPLYGVPFGLARQN